MGIKLYHNGQWVEFGGNAPTGSAAGADKQIQFNDNGALAGANQLEFDKGDATDGSPGAKLTLKPNYSGSSTTGTYGGGNIETQTNLASDNYPYNRSRITADGGIEIMRRRTVAPAGGPYLDFKAQIVSGNEEDFDSRIQMDYALESGSINPNSANYSSLTFLTGGKNYYDASTNPNGNVTEKLRITKDGDLVIANTIDSNPSNTVLGGGVYTRTLYMGQPGAVNNGVYTVNKDFFTFYCENGAIAGTAYGAVNGNYLSASFTAAFCTQDGADTINILADRRNYANVYQLEFEINHSGAYNNYHTFRLRNIYTHNGADPNPTIGGPRDPYVTLTVVMGAANKAITVTRP
tara:strand:- start:67 stop:1113 length:1047 start_codon:yes stop_codon:yes gene_type:complete